MCRSPTPPNIAGFIHTFLSSIVKKPRKFVVSVQCAVRPTPPNIAGFIHTFLSSIVKKPRKFVVSVQCAVRPLLQTLLWIRGVKVSALDLCPGDRGSIPRVVKMFINSKCSFRMRPWESLHA